MLTTSRNESDNELQVVFIDDRFRVVVDESLVQFDDHIGDPIQWRLHDAVNQIALGT